MGLKYYIYVSDSKVDMLFAQIPKGLLKRLAGELKINLGILTTSIKAEASEESRYSKLKIVESYIEKHESVGSIDRPLAYFRGEVDMIWRLYGDGSTVFFSGKTTTTVLGLGSSAHHVIGQGVREHVHSSSATPYLEAIIKNELGLPQPRDLEIEGLTIKEMEPTALEAMYLAAERMKGAAQRMEFLGKLLLREPPKSKENADWWRPPGVAVVLGTPIYVALAK